MSKRSRAQREIERLNRESLAQAQENPNKLDWPSGCSADDRRCHRPSKLAVIMKAGHGQYVGYSACSIHTPQLAEVFAQIKKSLDAAKSDLIKIQESGLIVPATAIPTEPAVALPGAARIPQAEVDYLQLPPEFPDVNAP